MKNCFSLLGLLILTVLLGSTAAQSQVYLTSTGEISFFSKTPLEDISAVSKTAQAAINSATGDVLVKIPMKSFKFPNGLMEDHFNENYMESEKYPEGVFKGKIVEKVDYMKDGTYTVNAKGTLTMHGVTKERTLTGTLEVAKGKLTLRSNFDVVLEDHKIERPSVVMMKIAEKIDVKSVYVMSPKAK